ncbi:ROK family protein [Mucilaginibacter galii]|uniref:Transcriptional regulator n=1 Tax=Mucilaginibacter galii TaxID=2005073 RepID=A0A917JBQ9_9SPHI|nr:ROK family protein [Mucilaginibacter galii]GGI51687.1 transcriptional regulator [Mucilaginibacter galii]
MPEIKSSILNTNAKAIKSLYYNESLTSTEVSAHIGKSIPHTIKVLNELIADGYVKENGYAISSGGRKPLHYSLITDTHFILSVAMNQYSMQLVFMDMNNNFITALAQHQLNTATLKVDSLFNLINDYVKSSAIEKNKILGLGLTMPGFIDTAKGINYTFLDVQGQSLVDYLQHQLLLPVFLENDSTAIALGELKFGIAMHQKDAMIVNLGWGIGLGMIMDGKIFRGHSGLAGEFSHIPLVKNGKLCTCGKHGCLETEASFIATIGKAKAELNLGQISSLSSYEEIDANAIMTEAIKGDVLSVKLISEAAYNVGQGIAILIHILNPASIVLSGIGSMVGKLWLSPIQQAINEHCIPRLAHDTELLVSNLNSKAQIIGGGALVVENIGKPLQAKMNALKKELSVDL